MNIVTLSIIVSAVTTLIGICSLVALWMKMRRMQETQNIPMRLSEIPSIESIQTDKWSLSAKDQKELLYHYKDLGVSGPVLAKRYKIPLHAVYYMVDRYYKFREPGKYKTRKRSPKISPRKAQKIADDYTVHKLSADQVADKYKVTTSTVYKVSQRLKKDRT